MRQVLKGALAKGADVVELPQEEWDFSLERVENCHLRGCVEWEYYRSIPAYREAVIRHREALKQHGTNTPGDESGPLRPLPIHHSFAEWPTTPFVVLSPHQKEAFKSSVDLHSNSIITETTRPLSDAMPTEEWEAVAMRESAESRNLPEASESRAVRFAEFKIDWTFSNRQLLECFRAFLRENRPKDIRRKESRGGGNTFRQLRKELKELGAWRLLQVMSWEAAFVYTKEVLEGDGSSGGALYSNHPEPWHAANKRASHKIEFLRASLFR